MLDAHAHVMQVKLCKANTRGVTFFSSNLRNRVTVIYVLACALLQAQKVIFLTKKIISMDRRTPLSGPKIPAIVQMIQLAHISFYILEDHMVLCCLRSILF